MDFLDLKGKTIVVLGLANKKSVGFVTAELLLQAGARLVLVVRSPARRESVAKLFPDGTEILCCDVEREAEVRELCQTIRQRHPRVHGLLHSIAFANYSGGRRPFHETSRQDFLQAMQISCHSLLELCHGLLPVFDPDASVVTISISTTRMAAENYGYMGPVKAALDSTVVFLAKSLSETTHVRVNAVSAGLLKTSASAGIPGYVDSYLFAELATLRKRGVRTQEVAATAAFLLSPRSQGINAQRVVVDAGMGVNYFDQQLVRRVNRP